MDAPTPEASPHRWIQAKRAGGGGSLPLLTTVALNESTQEWLLLDIADASDPVVCSDMLKDPRLELPAQLRQKILRLATP